MTPALETSKSHLPSALGRDDTICPFLAQRISVLRHTPRSSAAARASTRRVVGGRATTVDMGGMEADVL